MRAPVRLGAAALVAAASFATAAPADAACVGTSNTVVVCVTVNQAGLPQVDPTGGHIEDCVWVGSKCYTVSANYPTTSPGSGDILTIQCGGDIGQDIFRCNSPV